MALGSAAAYPEQWDAQRPSGVALLFGEPPVAATPCTQCDSPVALRPTSGSENRPWRLPQAQGAQRVGVAHPECGRGGLLGFPA